MGVAFCDGGVGGGAQGGGGGGEGVVCGQLGEGEEGDVIPAEGAGEWAGAGGGVFGHRLGGEGLVGHEVHLAGFDGVGGWGC